MNTSPRQLLVVNWFWPVFALALGAAWLMSRSMALPQPYGWDVALLLDFGLFMPLLMWLCYRRRSTRGALILRVLALQTSAVLIASWLTLSDQQFVVQHLAWLRPFGIAILIAFEGAVLVAMLRIVFKPTTVATDLEKLGAPPFIARLMLLEARFWRWVARLILRR